MKKFLALVTLMIASSLAACGAPPPAGSCSVGMAGAMSCISYTGSSVTMSIVQQGCTGGGGTYQSTDCPTANRVGRCTLPGSTAQLTQTAAYYAPLTTADAMGACTSVMGTFVAN